MVRVDVFGSSARGASGARPAGRRPRARGERAPPAPPADRLPGDPEDPGSLWRNPFFLKTILYAALLFGPSGAYLLWSFPDWETMQAGTRDLPAWVLGCLAGAHRTHAALAVSVGRRAVGAR